ncbi:AraC family transcriptional regulator [Tengunoibacter tsumagoiensis]|uniref:AraC family transcriptional regulator n=2 Tax=Tengunoibacter tsumagoiensis TaxID=2014871 RepID=A0A402A0R2_9CHLR|nr:AraC family transcriptional regulator [Tengunoibacter tsumagoiensis]
MYNPAMYTTEESQSPPPDILVSGHFKERPGYATYRTHGSNNWLLTYTIQGTGLYRQPGLELHTQPGDLILLDPHALHDYSVPDGAYWEFHWVHFQPRLTWFNWWHLPAIGQGLFRYHLQTNQERCTQAFARLHEAIKPQPATVNSQHALGPSLIQQELALNGLEEIFLLAAHEQAQQPLRQFDPRIQTILNLITQDLKAPYDLHLLARQVALSPSRLSHLFKQEIGDSVMNVLLSLRLRNAARLLEFSALSINTIAEEVGFHSAFYFSRQFHRHFGTSPSDYRARHLTTGKEQMKPLNK